MSVYVDTSVLLRLVLREPDTLADPRALDGGFTSAMAGVECARTLDRMRLSGDLGDAELAAARAAARDLISRLNVVAVDAVVLDRASLPFPTVVRTLDAVHLATALLLRESVDPALGFASHDRQQRTAGQALGFPLLG